MMRVLLRWMVAVAAGVMVTTLLGVAAQAHFTLEALGPTIGPVSLADRLGMIGDDWVGFGPRYGALVGAASLVTYALAALAGRFVPRLWLVWAIAAGVGGVLAVVFGLEAAFGQPVLKGAASSMGLMAQAVAGGLGGLVFGVLSRAKPASTA